MEILQNPTTAAVAKDAKQQFVDPRQEALIDYKAMNGLIVDEEGAMTKMTMQQLADLCQVDRTTLYEWMKTYKTIYS